MAPGLGRSRICGGLSLLWSAIKKKQAPSWGVLFLRKKAEPVRACHGLFFIASASCFCLCG